jgi:hypothetical protein
MESTVVLMRENGQERGEYSKQEMATLPMASAYQLSTFCAYVLYVLL